MSRTHGDRATRVTVKGTRTGPCRAGPPSAGSDGALHAPCRHRPGFETGDRNVPTACLAGAVGSGIHASHGRIDLGAVLLRGASEALDPLPLAGERRALGIVLVIGGRGGSIGEDAPLVDVQSLEPTLDVASPLGQQRRESSAPIVHD
jgi:hypothetical protein